MTTELCHRIHNLLQVILGRIELLELQTADIRVQDGFAEIKSATRAIYRVTRLAHGLGEDDGHILNSEFETKPNPLPIV